MAKTEAIKLLAIDDKPDNLTTLIAVVQDALPKARILTATNGSAGIELAATEDPDVILLDIVMPGMDGFEVCRRLKADDRIKDIPVVFLTALKTDAASRVKALEAGGEGFLAKPLETVELTAQIRTMTKVKAANRSQRTEKDRLEALVAEQTRKLQSELTERKRVEKSLRIEQAFSKALIDSIPGIFYVLDECGRFVRWNAYQRDEIVGRSEVDTAGFSAIDTIHPDDREAIRARIANVMKNGTVETVEGRVLLRGGPAFRWLLMTGRRMAIDGKTLLVGIGIDITERKRAEAALRTAERNLRSTVDGLSAHIAVLDEFGEIILTNKSYRDFAEQNGLDPRTVSEGTNYLAVCDAVSGDHSEEAKPFAEGIREVLSGKRQTFELEYPCHSPDEKRWFIGRVTRFAGEGPRRMIVAHENITEQKRAEERRQEGFDLLKNLARLVPGVIYQYKLYPDGRSAFPYSSPGMYDIYEVTPEEVRADASVVFGRIHPKDRERVADAISESARTLNTFHCELRVVLPKQGLRWRWSQAYPERSGDGGTLWHGIILDITERKRAEENLAASERILRDIMESTLSGFWDWNMVDNTEYLSPTFKRMFGYEDHEMESSPEAWQEIIFPEDLPGVLAVFDRHVKSHGREPFYNEIRYRHRDGSTVWVICAGRIIEWAEDGTAIRMAGCHINITKRKHAEAEREKLQSQFTQAQKMESVGRLAGGVAHDFNNLLMGIMGYADLCREELPEKHPVREWVEEITREVQRSTNLTRQLLAFARRQTVAPKVLDLNDAVGNMLKMLRRLIGEDIDLVWQPGAEPWAVKIDPGQVDQILANLCVNARDAIGGAGKIAIETKNVSIDADYCKEHAEAAPGAYVMLAVSDDGCGMDHETLGKVFEPFFTTKPTGEGTGLGLATVYGIVKQNNGFINVDSEPGKGTTFRIYLPRDTSVSKDATQAATKTKNQGGTETILLVEDERSIRVTIRLFLERFGYTVIAAESPAEALRLVAGHRDHLDLMITDVVMPGMSGRELAEKLAVDYPSMKILYMSGYTANVIAHRGILDDGVHFLSKPVGRDVLAQKVREVLGCRKPENSGGTL